MDKITGNEMTKKLTVAIAGCGSIAGVHASEISNIENATLISCCDINQDRGRSFAEKFGCTPYKSLRELFANARPDILHICAPHYTHVPLAIYAISRGTHVMLEKPAASTLTDLNLLETAVKNSSAQLAVCFQNRYNPSVVCAKKLLASGEAGNILGVRAFLTWRRCGDYYLKSDWRGSINTEGSGVLLNQAIHTIDLIHYFLGKPESISGAVSNRTLKDIINTEDTAEATFYYQDDLLAFFYATVGYCADETVIVEIHCEHMTLIIEGDMLTVKRPDGSKEAPGLSIDKRDPLGKSYWGSSHGLIIRDFYSHISDGRKFPLGAVEGGLALRTAFKILEG